MFAQIVCVCVRACACACMCVRVRTRGEGGRFPTEDQYQSGLPKHETHVGPVTFLVVFIYRRYQSVHV